jgi:histidine kinase
LLVSWILADSTKSLDKGSLVGEDTDAPVEGADKAQQALVEKNRSLVAQLALVEQEKRQAIEVKNKIDVESQELGRILSEKEQAELRQVEFQKKMNREFEEKRDQLEFEISRRKQIQGTLEANEQRYRGMIEGASDALLLSSSRGVVEYASPASQDLLGVAPEELLGSEIDFAISEDVGSLKAFIEKAENKSSIVYRIQVAKKDQPPVQKYVSHHLSYLDIPGKRRILIHSLRDVSAIKTAEAQKADYQKQLFHASKLASLGTMGAGIAHELNNPLAVIKGFSEKIRSDLLKTLGDSHGTISELDKILKQTLRMRTIIDQLRVFSRKDSGTDLSVVTADRLINDALILQRHQLSGSRIALEVNIPDHAPPLKVNLTHFESVIQNLVSNAYDAHASRALAGAVGNASPWIRISYKVCDLKTVEIEVEDNAGGIPKEVLPKIFDPFYTTKSPGKGTGLGLALVQSIVADHHGTIQVKSEGGQGTVFKITLPQFQDPSTLSVKNTA